MRKLLLIADNYPFGINESTFILPELPVLAERFEVVVASCNCTDEQTAPVPDGVRVIRIKMDNTLQKVTGRIKALTDPAFYRECGRIWCAGEQKADRIRWSHSYYAAGENFACALRRKLREMDWQPDIIYSYWHMTPLYGVLRRKKWFGRPAVVARAHGRDFYNFRNRYGWQSFKQESDRLLDAMFLISNICADYYKENFSVSQPPKYEVAYLGTDSERRGEWQMSETLRLFSCSNVIPLKRVELIVEALALIDDISISWTHAGDGDSMSHIRKLTGEKLAHKANIEYQLLGRVPNSEVKQRLECDSYDYFITASETEGLPVSIIEAYAFGVPAIATAVGGIPEIVCSDNGFLLPQDPSAQEIADTLRRAAALSEEERRSMRDSAYEKWQNNFVARDNARRFARRLEEICEARGK